MTADFDGFLARLNVTKSIDQSWKEALTFQHSIGFDLVTYGYLAVGTETEVLTLSNFPKDYQQRYRRERYDRDDALVHHCRDHMSPIMVGPNAQPRWPNQGRLLTQAQRRIIGEAADCGMKIGIVIPLRAPGRHPMAGMSMANTMRLAEFERFLASWGRIAQLAAFQAHIRIQMQLWERERSDREPDLSERERDSLFWTARGMSSKEVARKLGITPKTVDFHIANAMRKLHAATRCQAVAAAIASGWLEP